MAKTRFAAFACAAVLACLAGSAASKPRKLSSFDPRVNALLEKMTLD